MLPLTRRSILASVSALAFARPLAANNPTGDRAKARPLPLGSVRLKPSIWATAVETNCAYLLSLDADRLLHNFRKYAGLEPKAEVYGGWEGLGIAGHTLGHYMSALSLMYQQTGDDRARSRLRYIVSEFAQVQRARGDGYIGGTTVQRGGEWLDGKIVFEEVRRSDIRTNLFDLNGGWVPLYTWHKVQAGLIDAIRLGEVAEAKPVLVGMSDYLAGVLDAISDEQMQRLLVSEHGGLNETYADTYALTGNTRYLKLAERLRHRAVLDPLTRGKDVLPGLHANMQVPKVIGLARLYELAGNPADAEAARFFHSTVTRHHSYAIGGNSEREFFGPPDELASRLTDRTCEHCNTYNMLKLTRHLYSWAPDASWFDYYERAHLNHVMAAQDPASGQFVYYMPLASGAKRSFSTHHDNFWCCVGTGMESHAKHGDSIFWEDGRTLFVNLFIPSTLDWKQRGMKLDLDTAFPFGDTVTLSVGKAPIRAMPIAVRLPSWAREPRLRLNGKTAPFDRRDGYAVITRRWRAGDTIELTLPMRLEAEAIPGDQNNIAFTHGPVVLAADLGPDTPVWDGPTPGLLGNGGLNSIAPIDPRQHFFKLPAAGGALTLRPFFNQYHRRTAVYFPRYTQASWDDELRRHQLALEEKAILDRRTIDLLQPGELDQERAHGLATDFSEFWQWNGRGVRQAWWGAGHFVEASMAIRPTASALHVLYWGEDVNKDFVILVDGTELAHERHKADPVKGFVAVEYPLSPTLLSGKSSIRVRFEARGSDAAFYELRTVSAATSAPVPAVS
ncbi:MAG: glycoside hydrolase family 127 protein [Sphingomicrobium sp.]